MSRSHRNAKAEEYFRRAPNYSAEAVPDLRLWANLTKSEYPLASKFVEQLAEDLEASHKFSLPHGGRLFAEPLSSQSIEGFRPPFPIAAFEFDCSGFSSPEDKFHAVDVPRRIALCFDAKAALERQLGQTLERNPALRGLFSRSPLLREPSAIIWPIGEIRGRWVANWCGISVPYEQDPIPVTADMRSRVLDVMGRLGAAAKDGTRSKFVLRSAVIPLGDFGIQQKDAFANKEEYEWAATQDTADELIAVLQACAALSCTNVTTELLRPNREARAARPESTLFDYHVLMVRPGAERHEGPPLGGSHASPRTHLRRGHIRQHPTAGRIWVNSCLVNPTAIGTVNKDYRVGQFPGGHP